MDFEQVLRTFLVANTAFGFSLMGCFLAIPQAVCWGLYMDFVVVLID